MYSYWGKSTKESIHLLPYHSIDVAVMAYTISKNNGIRFSQEDFFIVALHDLGKFYSGFQHLVPDNVKKLKSDSYPHKEEYGSGYSIHHSSWGLNIWEFFESQSKKEGKIIPWLSVSKEKLKASFGHHGKPIEKVAAEYSAGLLIKDDLIAAKQYIDSVYSMKTEFCCEGKTLSSWEMAGLITLSDWLASNDTWIKFSEKEMSLDDYCIDSVAGAKRVPKGIYNLSAKFNDFSFEKYFGFDTPTPLQDICSTIDTKGQSLYILEDSAGAGKTEAAYTLASRMILNNGGSGGIYFALPTMATSNSLFSRASIIKDKMSPEGTLILAHSKAGNINYNLFNIGESTAQREAGIWLTDNRKKSLLCSFGVGTIDQLLSAVLPLKHQCLKLLGIGMKVLILDEVHSYDTYMLKEIETLIEFHASFGGSLIITSATLTSAVKDSLSRAFYAGIKKKPPEFKKEDTYPLMTKFSENKVDLNTCETVERLKRKVELDVIHDSEEIGAQVLDCLSKGGNVCIIKNTINDAIIEYLQYKDKSIEVKLFHSRFAFCDRSRIEKDILSTFGKQGAKRGCLLVATQVVEQSVDIDFDLMVSDICPSDMLIQRAGRCHRHDKTRPEGYEKVRVIVYPGQSGGWLKGIRGTGFIYTNHGVLYNTLTWIKKNSGILSCPDQIRDFIEYTYADNALPDYVVEATMKAEDKSTTDRGKASRNILLFDKGYSVESSEVRWEPDDYPMTRLIEGDSIRAYMKIGDNLYSSSKSLSEVSVPMSKSIINDDNEVVFLKNGKYLTHEDTISYSSEFGLFYGAAAEKIKILDK